MIRPSIKNTFYCNVFIYFCGVFLWGFFSGGGGGEETETWVLLYEAKKRTGNTDLSVASVVPIRMRGLGAGMDCRATAGE